MRLALVKISNKCSADPHKAADLCEEYLGGPEEGGKQKREIKMFTTLN